MTLYSRLAKLIVPIVLCLVGVACSRDPKIGSYGDPSPASIYNLRRVQVQDQIVLGETAIRAVVVSDANGGNFPGNRLIVQDLTQDAAINIELKESSHQFTKNDIVVLNLKGAILKRIGGDLWVTNLSSSQITSTGEQQSLMPKSTNIAALLANAKYWGPMLVKLEKITLDSESNKLNGKILIDDEIAEMYASFANNSVFATIDNPGFVQSLVGLASFTDNELLFYLRDLEDIKVGVDELLEDFELSYNTNYDRKVMTFITGQWIIDGGITANTAADPKNGRQSIRLQGTVGNNVRNGIIEMNFDLKGVKSISVSHGIYPATAELGNVNPTVFTVEISKDGGATYTPLGTVEVDTQYSGLKTTTFPVNATFNEAVRFRVVNTSIPFANNNKPRINIDDVHFKF